MKRKKIVDLKEKISKSDLFLVLGTRNYLNSLESFDPRILRQIELAYQYKKPVFLLIDIELKNEEKTELINYFRSHNVIKEMEFDVKDDKSLDIIAKEIKKLTKEYCGSQNNKIIFEDE